MEQNNGAGQVNHTILQLNDVTQQNASLSEELASNAEELTTQAEQLREAISYFKIDTAKNVMKKHSSLITQKLLPEKRFSVSHQNKLRSRQYAGSFQ